MKIYRDPRTGETYNKIPNKPFLKSGLHVSFLEVVEVSEKLKKNIETDSGSSGGTRKRQYRKTQKVNREKHK